MRILLVDDSLAHRRAGKRQLEELGHEVVATSDYTEAQRMAEKEQFDAALIDLLMPAEPTTLGSEAIKEYVGTEIEVGFPLMLALTMAGIPLVAVATDTNHHNHPASAMVDWFGEPMTINGATVLIMHAPMCENGAKNWGEILHRVLDPDRKPIV